MRLPESVEPLNRIIAEQRTASRLLLEALDREKSALIGRDAQLLADAAASKQAALERIEQLEGERRRLAEVLDSGPTGTDMRQLLDRLAAALPGQRRVNELRSGWNALLEMLRQCRDFNVRNGQLVAALQWRSQQTLNLLRGGTGEVSTYSSTGVTRFGGASARALARV
jgi:flagellar biosynthesis/type III secretory pathway chaperone